MSSQLAKKLLVISLGVLCLLVAVLYQLRGTGKRNSMPQPSVRQDITAVLRNSLVQQQRNFQRCWLQNSPIKDQTQEQQVWQIFLTVESNGRVKKFELLNNAFFSEETEKCLREACMRLRFPYFTGQEISFTIPITISTLNENR